MSAYNDLVLATSGLVSYWKLDEAAGSGSAADSQGSTTLTATSLTFGSTPVISSGTAASFDGSASTLANTSSTPVGAVANSSLEAWFRWTVGSQSDQAIVQNGAANNYCLVINGNGTSSHHLYLLNEGVAWHDTGYVVDGNPHHVVLSVSSGPTWTIYVDGAQVYSAGGSSNTPSGGFSIGCHTNGARKFVGVIDEVAVYNTALSASTAVSHYEAGGANVYGTWKGSFSTPPRLSGVVGPWSTGLLAAYLMQGSGPKAADLLGKYPAPLVSGVTWGRGSFGSELSFSGTTAQMVATGLNLAGQASFTVAVLTCVSSYQVTTDASGCFLISQYNSTGADYYLRYRCVPQLIDFAVGSATVSARPPYAQRYAIYVARFNAGAMDLFINGVQAASGSSGPGTVPSNASDTWLGGVGVSGAGPLQWGGGIAACYLWKRALGNGEVAALSADPLAPVRRPASRPWLLAVPTSIAWGYQCEVPDRGRERALVMAY